MIFICIQIFVQSQCLRFDTFLIVAGAMIMQKMFDTGTKHLSATDGQLKVFLGPCGWRNSIFKSPSCRFTSVTMLTHQNVFTDVFVDTTEIWKTLDVFCVYFFGQWFVEIKTLYPHMWVCKQFCCKILVQNGGYSLFQARTIFEFAKQSSRSAWILTISSWLTPKIRSNIDW